MILVKGKYWLWGVQAWYFEGLGESWTWPTAPPTISFDGMRELKTDARNSSCAPRKIEDESAGCSCQIAPKLNKKWWKKTRNQTVNRRLLEVHLLAKTPCKKTPKPYVIEARRLQFDQDHLDWTIADWRKIVFNDKTWCQISENRQILFVWRRPGKALLPECRVYTSKHPVKIRLFGAIKDLYLATLYVWI